MTIKSAPTSLYGVGVLNQLLLFLFEVVKAEVRDLHHETTVHYTVAGLEMTVALDVSAVEVRHALGVCVCVKEGKCGELEIKKHWGNLQ